MANKELATINSSGDLTSIQLGSINSTEKVLAQAEIDTKIKVTDDKITINTDDIATLVTESNITRKLGINIDTIQTNGHYEVDTNLPFGITLGTLAVQKVNTELTVSQVLSDFNSTYIYQRIWNGTLWTAWTDTQQSTFNKDITQHALEQTYDYEKIGGTGNEIIISDTPWVTILNTLYPDMPAGVYQYAHSLTYTYDSSSRSAKWRFSLDGGNNWEIRSREPKDPTDIMDSEATFPISRNFGDIHVILEAACESNSDTMVVSWASQVIERKK